jgi:hypothetical protein
VIHSCTSAATGGRGDDDDDDDDEDESWDLFESPPATPPSNDPMPANDPPPPPPIADLPIPTKKRGRARKPSDPKDANVQVRESLLEVGSAVYAPFPGKNPSHERTYTLMSNINGTMMFPFVCTIGNVVLTTVCCRFLAYYWGLVTRKCMNRNREFIYNIDFDDGDKLYNFSSRYLFRMEEILQEFIRGELKVLLKPPRKYIPLWNTRRDGPVPTEYFQSDADNRCTKCWQCMFLRQRCGTCALCRKAKERASPSHRHKYACIQTVRVEFESRDVD